MQENELRIGNIVCHTNILIDKGLVVTGILPLHIKVFDGEKSWIEKIEKFQPIPLTKEWLIDFGFAELLGRLYDEGGGGYLSAYLEGHKDYWLIGYADYRLVTIKYVHELQNLYFVLSNKELTLKP